MSSHTHKVRELKRVQLSKRIAEILRTVPYEKGFHFYTAPGNYTGETATSLDEFERKVQMVPDASVAFHLQRGDFQKWIEGTLSDDKLAKRITLIKLTLPVEDSRKELLTIVQARINQFKGHLSHHTRHAPS
jgi:hypothetical protein